MATTTEYIDTIKKVAPGYDRPLHVKVRYPDKYGIVWTSDVKDAIRKRYGAAGLEYAQSQQSILKSRKSNETHIQARIHKSQRDALKCCAQAKKITLSALLRHIISEWLKKETAAGRQSTTAAM